MIKQAANILKKIVKVCLPYGIVIIIRMIQRRGVLTIFSGLPFSNKIFNSLGYNQISNATGYNRYPEIFCFIASRYNINDHIKILSFGCSYGLECFTIRNYFKNAKIVGYDISKNNIEKANANNRDEGIKFYYDFDKLNNEKFDVIFAMSVLCRWKATRNKKDCSKIYSFTQFSQDIEILDRYIYTGGI